MPVDQVVDFMVKLIDDSYKDLPPVITMEATEMGRLTQPAALALKAKNPIMGSQSSLQWQQGVCKL